MFDPIWNMVMGDMKVPEGFQVAFGQDVSLAGPAGWYAVVTDHRYDFWLEGITARYPRNSTGDRLMAFELFRDTGQRSLTNLSLEMQLVSTPGESDAGKVAMQRNPQPIGMLFEAGGLIQIKLSDFNPVDDIAHVVCVGRYILKQAGAW